MISFKGAHFKEDIILTRVRWYVADPSSYRQAEELMQERRAAVDHATIGSATQVMLSQERPTQTAFVLKVLRSSTYQPA